ncbi:MAG: hypothetical protein RLZZ383_980 [Pseudomonadota bacterium]
MALAAVGLSGLLGCGRATAEPGPIAPGVGEVAATASPLSRDGVVGLASRRIAAEIEEPSGLVASRRHPGVWWTLGDSGTAATVFGIDRNGVVVARLRLEGAPNIDWEDVAVDPSGDLYVADLGNNANTRRDLAVYRVPEPETLGDHAVRPAARVGVAYADQRAFPDPAALNFDAEAVFHDGTTLWIWTKHRSDNLTTAYRLPSVWPDQTVTLAPMGTFDLGPHPVDATGRLTAASLSADGRWLALLAYHGVWILPRPPDGVSWWQGAPTVHRLDVLRAGQVEAVAWHGEGLILLNERKRWWYLSDPFTPSAGFPPMEAE